VSEPFALQAYRTVAAAAEPVAEWLLRRRLGRGKEISERVCERRGIATAARPSGPLIWLHGASVGELNSVLPLIERLHARGLDLLVTSGTVTSSKVAAQRLPHGVIHQFVPFDIPPFVRSFLDQWKPQLALFVESDLWPNMLTETAARGIPMLLVNARLSERSFERWRRIPASIRYLLSRFDLALARTQLDADRLNALSAPRVVITGDLKLDVPAPPAEPTALAVLKAAIGSRSLLAAASTHLGEDEHVIAAHRALRDTHPKLLTIIAPRHPERGGQIAELARGAGLTCALRSQGALPTDDVEIYIADTLGELGLLYRIAPAVFIGGSLVQHGGQNPIEPAKLGAAVLHGPHVWNFAEIYTALDAAHGALPLETSETLTDAFAELLAHPQQLTSIGQAGKATVDALGGGLDRTLAALEPYLAKLEQQRDRADA
jgi:3-deoxy-D-manno-octulosonic-acid transferase